MKQSILGGHSEYSFIPGLENTQKSVQKEQKLINHLAIVIGSVILYSYKVTKLNIQYFLRILNSSFLGIKEAQRKQT